MPRLIFEKTGSAVWISHLDLMRLFQRAFKRAGLALKHSQGFSPRPLVAIALPLSVGVESRCELMDFDLEGETPALDTVAERLNEALVEGVRVLEVYDTGRQIKDLAYLDCTVSMDYDNGVPAGAEAAIRNLFAQASLTVSKKSKNGMTEQDIIPMIKNLTVGTRDNKCLEIKSRICCQNPSMNPLQLHGAVVKYLPEFAPDFARCRREEIYDTQNTVFR